MVEIAVADARDIAAIMPVMNEAFDPLYGESWTAAQCLSVLSMPGTRLIIACKDKKTVGFAISRWILDEEELLMIGVAPFARRQSIASSLFDNILENMADSSRSKLYLEVRRGNDAYFFYQRRGFIEIGQRKNYYRGSDGRFYDAITMVLAL
jgi:ribosomal-protein-alanine N-acetyltransferase